MRIGGAVFLTLGVELLVGVALFACGAWLASILPLRRRKVTWTRAARALVWAVPPGVGLLAVAATLILTAGEPVRLWVTPAPFALAGGVALAGCYLMLHAGRLEAAGKLRAARRQARFGGSAMLFGVLAQLIQVWSDLLFDVVFRRATLGASVPAMAAAVAMLSLGVAAFIGVVAGLAGKPRPSAYFGGLFLLVGVVGLALVAQLT